MSDTQANWRTHHPGLVALLLLAHTVLFFLWENPLLLLGQLTFLMGWAGREKILFRLRPLLRWGGWFSLLFLLINALFSRNGELYLWKGPVVSYLGRLDLTVEELSYCSMGLVRLLMLLILSVMYQQFVDHDRLMLSFVRMWPRMVLTGVLAIRLIPLLTREWTRIEEIARIRGIRPASERWRDQVAHRMLLVRPLLHTALEGSWLTAETLYARGFGSGKRTVYRQQKLTGQEAAGFVLAGLMLAAGIWGVFLSYGRFAFYPRFSWPDPAGDLMFLAMLALVWWMPVAWLKRRRET